MELISYCPKCSNYIIGEYCYSCDIDLKNYVTTTNDKKDNIDIFKAFKDMGINIGELNK